MESIIIAAIFSLFLGIVITYLFELVLKSNKTLKHRYYSHHKIFWGYHIHHSVYGLVSILIGIALFFNGDKDPALDAILFGFGIIAQHTNSDGKFVFIEKQINK